MHMDGNTRLLIVGGAMALVAYFGWPYFKGEMGEIGRQMSGNHAAGFPPMFDPLGLIPNRGNPGEGDYAARPDRRLRLGVGNASENPWENRQGRYPTDRGDQYSDRQEPMPRRWRDCGPAPNGRFQCGPWHDGAPPRSGGGRW
jgi:hypothetical protein